MHWSSKFLTAGLLIGLATAAAVILAAAPAQAQSAQIEIVRVDVPDQLIFPELDNPSLDVTYKYSINNPGLIPITAINSQVSIALDIQCLSPDVVVSGARERTMQLTGIGDTPQQEWTQTSQFRVSITRDAPGLQLLRCEVTARASELQSPSVSGVTSAPAEFTVRADYYALAQVRISGQQIQQAGPQKEVPFPIEVTNFGNARTQFTFSILERPEGDRWSPVVPDQVILESPNTGRDPVQQTSTFTVSTPWKNGWNNQQGTFTLNIRPIAADNPEKVGNEIQTNVLVRVRGVYVPGFELVGLLGAIVIIGYVAYQRRDGDDDS